MDDNLSRAVRVIAIAVFLLAYGVGAQAAPGELDRSFSEDGWNRTIHVMHDEHSMLPELAEDIAFDSDGNIVATGEIVSEYSGWWFGMFRYAPAGELDESFGDNGAAMTPAAGRIVFPHGIAVQTDDKPVVVGSADCENSSCFGIGRYLTNGMRDPDFGNDGFVRTQIGWSSSVARGVALDARGRIVVVGWKSRGGSSDDDETIAVARFLPDGRLDNSFSGDGKASFNVRPGDESATDIHVSPDGRIYITGSVDLTYSKRVSDFLILRLRESGKLDPSFSNDGLRLFDVGGFDVSNGSALGPDGDLVLVGSGEQSSSPNGLKAAAVRFSSSGAFDRTFGKKLVHPGAFGGYFNDVSFHPSGDVVVAGRLREEEGVYVESEWFVMRWNANGTRDESWGSSGMVRVDFGTGEDEAYDVEVDERGRVVVGGSVYAGLGIARFLEE